MFKIFKKKNVQIAYQFCNKTNLANLMQPLKVQLNQKQLIQAMTFYIQQDNKQIKISDNFYQELDKQNFDKIENNLIKLQFLNSTNALSDKYLFDIMDNHIQESNLQCLINLSYYLSQAKTIYKNADSFYENLLQILNNNQNFDIHNFTYSIHSLYQIAKNQNLDMGELRQFCQKWQQDLNQNIQQINPKFLPVFLDLLDQQLIIPLIKEQLYNFEPTQIENLLFSLQNIESQELWSELQELIQNNIDEYSVSQLCQILVYYFKSGNANKNIFQSIEVSIGQRYQELDKSLIPIICEVMIQSGFYRQKFFNLIQDQAAEGIENYTIDDCISVAYCFSRSHSLKKNSSFFLKFQKKMHQVELSGDQLGKLCFSLVQAKIEFFYQLQKSIPENPIDFICVYFYQNQPSELKDRFIQILNEINDVDMILKIAPFIKKSEDSLIHQKFSDKAHLFVNADKRLQIQFIDECRNLKISNLQTIFDKFI